jgi:uncharacterized cofD-like protein
MRPLTDKVVDYIEHQGIKVKESIALEIPDNLEVAAQNPLNLLHIYKQLDLTDVDVLVASACVQMPSLEAIADADLICVGPGSVYTSVIPNLLIPGVAAAMRDSRALKVYICNVMTQPGESDTFSASEHVSAILAQVKERVFDYVVVNTGVPSQEALEKYRTVGQNLVDPDIDRIRAMGLRVISGNFMSESDFVRHDPVKVVSRLMTLLGL